MSPSLTVYIDGRGVVDGVTVMVTVGVGVLVIVGCAVTLTVVEAIRTGFEVDVGVVVGSSICVGMTGVSGDKETLGN